MSTRLAHLASLSADTHGGFKRGETPLRQFQIHRASAKHRGVEFKLSFDQWEQWWKDSGHYHERGKERGQYVMARKGDLGAYELGNIECIPTGENIAAAHTGKIRNPPPMTTPTKPTKEATTPLPVLTEERVTAKQLPSNADGDYQGWVQAWDVIDLRWVNAQVAAVQNYRARFTHWRKLPPAPPQEPA